MNGSGEVELDLVTSGGTASLITIDGATATYDDNQFVVSGTVVEDLTGDDLELFKGSFALPYSGASTSTLTDSGPFAGKFDLGGVPITITSLTFESNQLLAGFKVAIPFTQGVINLATSTLGFNFGLVFDNSGPQLGVGGTITLPQRPRRRVRHLHRLGQRRRGLLRRGDRHLEAAGQVRRQQDPRVFRYRHRRSVR
jgi:hypothetical protein